MVGVGKKVRHILGLSGGKDSAALAIYLHKMDPQLEYFFCDTHKELPETYEFLHLLSARLGIRITYLSAERGFDHWLDVFGGLLPSPTMRWCTKQLKIKPLEKFVGDDEAISYVGIRADEQRDGYIAPVNLRIRPVYPFVEAGLRHSDILRILKDSGIGLPRYYEWRSRSGCYFCFFQRKYEWVMLSKKHPDLYKKARKYEEGHSDGRQYYWNDDESLAQIIERQDEIVANHLKSLEGGRTEHRSNRPLSEVLFEDDVLPCIMCK